MITFFLSLSNPYLLLFNLFSVPFKSTIVVFFSFSTDCIYWKSSSIRTWKVRTSTCFLVFLKKITSQPEFDSESGQILWVVIDKWLPGFTVWESLQTHKFDGLFVPDESVNLFGLPWVLQGLELFPILETPHFLEYPSRFSSFQCCQPQSFLPSIFLTVLQNRFTFTRIETRLRRERLESVMGECVILFSVYYNG